MYQQILNYAPDTWVHDNNSYGNGTYRRYEVAKHSSEFNNIQSGIRQEMYKLERVQNIHDFGQLLLKEQVLAIENPNTSYYRVRRYIMIDHSRLKDALEYNIDCRRCGLPPDFSFNRNPPHYVANGKVLLVVQVVTDNPHDDYVTPIMSNEYFIEYVAYMVW